MKHFSSFFLSFSFLGAFFSFEKMSYGVFIEVNSIDTLRESRSLEKLEEEHRLGLPLASTSEKQYFFSTNEAEKIFLISPRQIILDYGPIPKEGKKYVTYLRSVKRTCFHDSSEKSYEKLTFKMWEPKDEDQDPLNKKEFQRFELLLSEFNNYSHEEFPTYNEYVFILPGRMLLAEEIISFQKDASKKKVCKNKTEGLDLKNWSQSKFLSVLKQESPPTKEIDYILLRGAVKYASYLQKLYEEVEESFYNNEVRDVSPSLTIWMDISSKDVQDSGFFSPYFLDSKGLYDAQKNVLYLENISRKDITSVRKSIRLILTQRFLENLRPGFFQRSLSYFPAALENCIDWVDFNFLKSKAIPQENSFPILHAFRQMVNELNKSQKDELEFLMILKTLKKAFLKATLTGGSQDFETVKTFGTLLQKTVPSFFEDTHEKNKMGLFSSLKEFRDQNVTQLVTSDFINLLIELYFIKGDYHESFSPSLTISEKNIDFLNSLKDHRSFKELTCENVRLKERHLYALSQLSNLHHLHFYNVFVSDFSFLKYLTELTHLQISKTNLKEEDLNYLASLSRLESLQLQMNRFLKNISPLENIELENLKVLNLSSTLIENVSPLNNFKRLEELVLGNTHHILDLRVLNLPNLKKICLLGTPLKNPSEIKRHFQQINPSIELELEYPSSNLICTLL